MRPMRGGPVRRAPIAGALLLLMTACSAPPEPPPEITEIVLGDLVRSLPITLEDSILFGVGSDLAAYGELLFVSEGPRHQITMLDTLLQFRGRIGREGRGPGELRYPTDLEITPGGLVTVVEGGNGRFSVFRQSGEVESVYRPIGQRAIVPLSDSSFVVTSTRDGYALELVTAGVASPFGPPEGEEGLRVSDFQSLLPARLSDGTPLIAHIRSADRSFRLLDHSGRVVRDISPPTAMSTAELERANREAVERTSRALGGARVLGAASISAGQTSPDGRWIPLAYHEFDDRPYLYDVWTDRWYRLRHANAEKVLPARPSVVIGDRLYVYEIQRGIFAYEIDLPE